jgi:dihydroorotate dehydrogenase
MRDDARAREGFPSLIYRTLRPILFRLDPEAAHTLSLGLMRFVGALPPVGWVLRRSFAVDAARPVEAFGLRFPNAVGLAAGYDKDAVAWRGLARLGFGHVEIGTVTPRPQPGNPRPRVFRLASERSLINRLGFPSRGADYVARRLQGRPPAAPIVGVNLGKQRETPLERAADDYESLMERFAPLADYLAVNVSSPNTPELRQLQQREWLEPLLERLVRRRVSLGDEIGRRVPLLLKLSPDLTDSELDEALAVMVAAGIDGVIATNTTTSREGLSSPWRGEAGGLSGAALRERSTRLVRAITERTGGSLPVVACGGVMGPTSAREKLDAGASLVQLYTGLIYEGPSLAKRILAAGI